MRTEQEQTNAQLAEAAALGVKVDGRWCSSTLAKVIADARRNADAEDALHEERIRSMTEEEISSLERQMLAEKSARAADRLLVYLDFDLWIEADQRIRANHDIPQYLPFDFAKKMLVIGKARRAAV